MEIAQLVFDVIIIILALYVIFFKSYFQEKGKNLATKEDIAGITRLVETVKNQIHYNTQSKLSLKTEERNALVNFYECYNYWLNISLDIYFGGISEDNNGKLVDLESRLNDAKFKYEMAEGRKDLFVNNKELDDLLKELKIKTLELQHIVQRKIGELEHLFLEIEMMKTTISIENQSEKYKKLLAKKSKIMSSLNTERLEKYGVIAPMEANFKVLVFNHLQYLIKN